MRSSFDLDRTTKNLFSDEVNKPTNRPTLHPHIYIHPDLKEAADAEREIHRKFIHTFIVEKEQKKKE